MHMHITRKLYYSPAKAVNVEIGQHFEVDGRKGHATLLGRKYVTVLLYGGPRVKVDPLINPPLDTHHQ